MNRRDAVLALLALGVPLRAWAQPAARIHRIGMLLATNPGVTKNFGAAFTARMAELGWREGSNIEYTWRYAESDSANFERLATETVARKPDVIFVGTGPFAAVVKKHTQNIPIVFTNSTDPVGQGLVASLARPGGNVTGASTRTHELAGKRLQLLQEVVPLVKRIGLVRRVGVPDNSEAMIHHEALKRAAAQLRLQLVEVEHDNRRAGDFGPAFAQLLSQRVDAVASVLGWNYPHYREFVAHAARARLPGIFDASEFAEAGGLMSLSVSFMERFRKSADYVNRILRGAKPAELPVDEPMVFELIVNLKTAREIGVTIPQSILLRADRVIE
jgi:putative ABC transport system substrate-binding protein